MRRLICTFVLRIWHKTRFRMTWPSYVIFFRAGAVRGTGTCSGSFYCSLTSFLSGELIRYEPSHEIMVLFTLCKLILQMGLRSHPVGSRCLIFGRTLRLLSCFMYANREGSGETARMRRLTWAFTGHLCDKYHNLMSWFLSGLETQISASDIRPKRIRLQFEILRLGSQIAIQILRLENWILLNGKFKSKVLQTWTALHVNLYEHYSIILI